MGEGFILLTRGSDLFGGLPPPFDTLKIGTSIVDIKLELYRSNDCTCKVSSLYEMFNLLAVANMSEKHL